jgi:hypothetical protein
MNSINVEGEFFLRRVEFFKISKHDFMFIRDMRVLTLDSHINTSSDFIIQ